VPLRNYDPLTAHDPSPWLRRVFPDHFGSKQLHVVAFREELKNVEKGEWNHGQL